MNTFYKLQNDYGVKVNVRAQIPNPEERGEFCTILVLDLPSPNHPITTAKKNIQHLLSQSKRIFIYVISLPLLLGKKLIEFFEHNPYSYPMYPFHFPILLHSDYDLFGYTDHWDLLDQQIVEAQNLEEEQVKAVS